MEAPNCSLESTRNSISSLMIQSRNNMSRYHVNFYVLRLYFVYYGLTDRRISTFFNISCYNIALMYNIYLCLYVCYVYVILYIKL